MPLRDVERLAILQTLDACRGNRAEAARRLGISKKGIYLKMKRLGLSAECV
jgi:DNA-binding NtrC family response regulator